MTWLAAQTPRPFPRTGDKPPQGEQRVWNRSETKRGLIIL